jgi:hypothetical protein
VKYRLDLSLSAPNFHPMKLKVEGFSGIWPSTPQKFHFFSVVSLPDFGPF